MPSEAQARIKINKHLESAGWRFFKTEAGPANIITEYPIKITPQDLEGLGEDFQHTKQGRIDFLLLDQQGFPLVVLEAKAEDKDPLIGKEQARTYANNQNVRFVILSNGNPPGSSSCIRNLWNVGVHQILYKRINSTHPYGGIWSHLALIN